MGLVELYQSYSEINRDYMTFIEETVSTDFKNNQPEEILQLLTQAKKGFEELIAASNEIELREADETNFKDLKYLLVDALFLAIDLLDFYKVGEEGRFKMRVLNHLNKKRRAEMFNEANQMGCPIK
ncbi:hypothetical protein [Cellulosilyticum sp. WCF-2]|uniref:hypothetical protein n=1 Tax=Cellulosilyticum sp. WCF-2 TaxID=2497860 RepID=UPI000F8E5213|nr:hypothetical protein [Cellulosilyticum sp. WCF-2]QEH67564.1 hypothetical protein EKH84_03820 [Cellulosilyticum sp. WCF-2]